MIVMKVRAHHEIDLLGPHAGDREPVEIRLVKVFPKGATRLLLVVPRQQSRIFPRRPRSASCALSRARSLSIRSFDVEEQ